MDKFSYEANGYNRDEVNQFVNDVIKETEDIVKRVESQRDEIIYLKKELAHYKELEDTLKKTIITAEETKKEMMHQAERECEMIVTNAKHNASRIVNEALIEAEKATSYAKSLQKTIKALKSGKTTLNIWIPKRNIKKDIELNILSTLEGEVKTFLDKYNVTPLHKSGFKGDNIKVAILDSGVNKVGNIDSVNYAPNYINLQPTSSKSDVYGQGTVTASIVKSIAPNCTLYSLKNQSNGGYNCTNESLVLKSLQWCIDNKMDIVIARNLQLGSYANKDKLFKQMNDANMITIVSQLSGDALKFSSNPTSNVLCAGLLNTKKKNNVGYIDVTCYEDGFPVYDKDGYFSLSTKLGLRAHFGIVGGICTLLKQQNPNLNVTKLKAILPSICTNIGEFKYFGYGIMKAGLI